MKKVLFLMIATLSLRAVDIDGFYKVPNFLMYKGAYVYAFNYHGQMLAYGVANLNNTPAKKDTCNPNKKLRTRSDKGVIFLKDLRISNTKLEGGISYNFQDCFQYYTKGEILQNGDLKLTFSLDSTFVFAKSVIWHRLSESEIKELHLEPFSFDEVIKTLQDK
ncbi:Uncharacterised protein [Helicobacter fennelliae]|uniref:DUF2147 domain-containing protein n=1 Tax=Helicobacter fennelliae TaxID=215 RepID=A0A2X3B910_9HELI|nr:DUF2147 domain-containing protein [Helicobacter fennelliae]SQB98237.1 Uncharacterised protein [Helicobacter fennelliae]